jgi:hypothetical protein
MHLTAFALATRGSRGLALTVGLLVLAGCQHAVTGEQIQAKRVVVDQRCRAEAIQRAAVGDRAQAFTKLVACTNGGYRQGLLELQYPYMDLANEWMEKRIALATDFDTGRAIPATARERFAALLAEFVANVRARNTERKETAQAACQILGAVLVIATVARGGFAFAECN